MELQRMTVKKKVTKISKYGKRIKDSVTNNDKIFYVK